jgi:RNA-directed DNA polymerase
MMHGPGKSDSAILAEKPTNKAGKLAADPVERRAEAEGNASQQSTLRAQNRVGVSDGTDRTVQVRTAAGNECPKDVGLSRKLAGSSDRA